MTILQPAPVSSLQFNYDHVAREFSADMSSLNGFGRVYDDATDEGLTVVSHATGVKVVFVLTDIEYDRERDVVCWKLASVPTPGWTMTIWNT